MWHGMAWFIIFQQDDAIKHNINMHALRAVETLGPSFHMSSPPASPTCHHRLEELCSSHCSMAKARVLIDYNGM